MKILPAEGYRISESDAFDAVWATELVVDGEGITANKEFFLKEIATGSISDKIGSGELKIDKTAPAEPEITYSQSELEKTIEMISFGFYKAQMTVTIKVEDAVSGVDHIVYNIGNGDVTVPAAEIKNGEVSFKIDPMYKGSVTATVYDVAGHSDAKADTKVLVVDNAAPGVTVSFDNESAVNGNYFKAKRTATITVVEDNFYPEDVVITAQKRGSTDSDYVDMAKPEFAPTTDPNTYEAKIEFAEDADYKFDISATDKSGNTYDGYDEVSFTVDTTKPRLAYEGVENGKDYAENKTLTLKVEEHNFNAADVNFTISAVDADNNSVDLVAKGYVDLKKRDSRVQKGDIYTSEIELDIEGHYTVGMTYTDLAGNEQAAPIENLIFSIDKTAPTIKLTYDNNSACNSTYYKADRTVTVEIAEHNFDKDDVTVVVGKQLNTAEVYTETTEALTFTRKSDADVYTATYTFAEDADYTLKVSYKDKGGNTAEATDAFTVDKTVPAIAVSYDNNNAQNGKYFKADRVATIVITEHNFNAADVKAVVKAGGTEVAEYSEYLKKADSWTKNGDAYTATIKYTEEAHYEFAIDYADLAGNANAEVGYGDSVAPTQFTLDKSAPVNLTIDIGTKSVLDADAVAFDTFYAEEVVVKLSANCDISGMHSLQYQKVDAVSKYDANGTWTAYDAENGIKVAPNEKFIIYFRAEDRAGNVTIVNSTGIVVDDQKPEGSENAPELDIILPEKDGENGFYKSDVEVNLAVLEPKFIGATADDNGYYSGPNKITYKIYTMDTPAVEEGVLLDVAADPAVVEGATVDTDALISKWIGKIVIDAEKFNSNNVIVELTAVDNAGNSRTTATTVGDIKIDVTAPAIEVTYDNDDVDSDSYFKAERTATIEITERNFNPANVDIKITNTDGVIPAAPAVLEDWEKVAGADNGDETTWTATIAYEAEGDYTFSVSFKDDAGWKNYGVNYGDSAAPEAFTIDKTLPVVTVSYDNNSALNGNYYKAEITATRLPPPMTVQSAHCLPFLSG